MLLALYFLVLIIATVFMAIRASRLKALQRPSFRIYAAAFGLLFGYLFAELAVTTYYGFSWAGTSLWLFDESGKTVHFDPIRGYILTPQPSRWARISNGTVEFVAWLKGNSQGFPSRRDFSPQRPDSSTRRIAVFGDSFSAGDYLDTNWPDRTQALAEASGERLQLLNFSLDGIGLANWWSIVTRFVAVQNYELDGVVFVVFDNDLERKFWVAENHGARLTWRRCQDWNPQTYPATVEQTASCPFTWKSYMISDHEFEQALSRKWPPSIPRSELGPALATQIIDYMDRWWDSKQESLWKTPGFDPQQAHLIEDIRLFISSRKLPVLVVYLPTRDRLVKSEFEDDRHRVETMAFAKAIGARFVDGSGAFANMRSADVRKCFFPYDAHWNQTGSDRFAKFMLDLIPRSFPERLQASR